MALAQMMQEQYGNQIPDWYGDAVCSATERQGHTIACKTDDLTEPKIPPEPLEQGGAGGIFCCYSAEIFSGRD